MKTIDLTTIQGKDLIIDVTKLISDEVLYINATRLARQFGKDRRQLEKFLKTKSFLEYEKALFKVIQKGDFKIRELPLRFTKKGKTGGTYLHSDVVIVFLRWLDIKFAVQCDMYIKKMIQKTHNEKIEAEATAKANKDNDEWLEAREKAKETRKGLSDTIKAFCEYAETERGELYKSGRCPYYIKLTNLVYKTLELQKPKGARSARDVFNGAIVEKIEYLEDVLSNLLEEHIQHGTEYHEAYKNIKEIINNYASQGSN